MKRRAGPPVRFCKAGYLEPVQPFMNLNGRAHKPQVRARFLYIQARNAGPSGANLGFAVFRRRQLQIVLCHQAHTVHALYVSHFGNRLQGPSTFPLISVPRLRYYRASKVIYKITAFFDNLTRAQRLAIPNCESDQPDEGETLRPAFCCCSERRRNRPD